MDEPLPFPFASERLFSPPERFRTLRDERPVARVRFPTGDEGWLVTRYADVRTVLMDPRFSRAAAARRDAPRMRPMPADPATILSLDPPAHTRLHKLVVRAFSARRVDALRPRITELTTSLLDAMATSGPPADLVASLALPLPIAVIADLLGIPPHDRARFRDDADTMLSLHGHTPEEVRAAREHMNAYLAEIVAAKRATPPGEARAGTCPAAAAPPEEAGGDDLIGALVRARDEDALSERELVTMAATLLIAGYHTTSSALSGGVLTLLRQGRDAWAATRGETVGATVDELLRYAANAVNGGNLRVATEDVKLGGVLIRAGDAVLPSTVSANRDAGVFKDPDRFDPARADNPHIAFGAGPHYCLGARLARLELTVALHALFARFPTLRLAVPEEELRPTGTVIRGLERLPVTW